MSTNQSLAHSRPILTAIALSLGAAVSLGLARFSYALLLPVMRDDLSWPYLLAGAINTGNAFGYFVGALLTPAIMRRAGAQTTLIFGTVVTGVFLIACGFTTETNNLMVLRVLAGIASALIFVAGGVLAARLGTLHMDRAGLLIGLYYGGTGLGIFLSSLLVPLALTFAHAHGYVHTWQPAWIALGLLSLITTAIIIRPIRGIDGHVAPQSVHAKFRSRPYLFGLSAYFMFGAGYIGYMTFIIALLKEQGMATTSITIFYSMLGLSSVLAARIWAGMLDKYKGGESMAILCALLCVATVLPLLSSWFVLVFVSGILFGGAFLSVVASTTALVRHNSAPTAWSSGIGMFTTVFALGQIAGPTMVGWISDHFGGLRIGLGCSALILIVGAALATQQKPLQHGH